MKLSQWHSGDVKPVRVGVYERLYDGYNELFCYWDGYEWGVYGFTKEQAFDARNLYSCVQDIPWRDIVK